MTDSVDRDGSGLMVDLENLAIAAVKAASEATQAADELRVVAFFDLTGSTEAKFARGNQAVARDAHAFTTLATEICARFGGQVVKSMGDGALAMFPDPMAACEAALQLRHATHQFLEWEMTAGLTSGRPMNVSLGGGRLDILGDVVDRAARIQALAAPGQVLIDSTLYNQVRADIAGLQLWEVDPQPRKAFAKGIGPIDLFELCLRGQWRLKAQLATPFAIVASGRPSVDEKLALIRNAKTEIIEIGIGLTSFAKYFPGQKPAEFADPIRRLVRSGVDLNCFALDPTYAPGLAWEAEQGNPNYRTEARIAKDTLLEERRHCESEGYLGQLSYYTYRRVPEFWCLGVDVDDPINGRMFFAPYLMGVSRSATPAVQVSRLSHSELYAKYALSVQAVRNASNEKRDGRGSRN